GKGHEYIWVSKTKGNQRRLYALHAPNGFACPRDGVDFARDIAPRDPSLMPFDVITLPQMANQRKAALRTTAPCVVLCGIVVASSACGPPPSAAAPSPVAASALPPVPLVDGPLAV